MNAQVNMILSRLQSQAIQLVCVGASAGAIDILSQLLPRISTATALAFSAVVHLPPDRESLLAKLFQGKCMLKVEEVWDKRPIEPGTIYFAPPSYHVLVERNGVFSLSVDAHVHYSRPSIDVLFESAADSLGPRVLGLILTGANQDGASGLKAIYESGGVAVVQRPVEAEAAMMPESALARCPSAFSLSNSELLELFGRI